MNRLVGFAALAFVAVLTLILAKTPVPQPPPPPSPPPVYKPAPRPPPVAQRPAPPAKKVFTKPELKPCVFPGLKLPPRFKILAAGEERVGRPLDFGLDNTGRAMQIDVGVNSDEPVVLFLTNRGATVWNIGWTSPRTNIVAVFVSGFNAQAVAGISSTTPVMIATRDDSACEDVHLGEQHNEPANALSRKLFGRPIDKVFLIQKDKVLVGDAKRPNDRWMTSNWRTVSALAKSIPQQAGDPELTTALKLGYAHVASADEREKAVQVLLKIWSRPAHLEPADMHYHAKTDVDNLQTLVITRPFPLPERALNRTQYLFILSASAQEQPLPTADFNIVNPQTGKCFGPICGRFRGR